MQIIVLGMHRSGTSLVTRLVNMMGAFFGVGESSIGFNDENPKGFWERRDAVSLNNDLLAHFGCSWEQLAAWKLFGAPGKKEAAALQPFAGRIKRLVLEMDANRPWVIKDPRLCLTFPFWRPHLEVPVILAVSRDPLEVALSLKQRNGFSLAHGLAIWEYYSAGVLAGARGLPAVYASHAEVLAQPYASVERLFTQLGEKGVQGLRMPSRQEVESFIEPAFYRSKAGNMERDAALTPHLRALHAQTQGKEPVPPGETVLSPAALDAMEVYRKSQECEAQLAQANSNFAAADQQRAHLAGELPRALQRVASLERALEQRVSVEEKLRAIEASTSWKLGHGVVRLARLLTLRTRSQF